MPTLNPWLFLGTLLAALVLFGTGYEYGHKHGVNAQKAGDQSQFDAINAKIAQQKADAAAIIRANDQAIIAEQQKRDVFKTQLLQEKQDHEQTNSRLRDQLYVSGLRFQSAEAARAGDGGKDGLPAEGGAASNASASRACIVSDETSRAIVKLVSDCSSLATDYKMLYDFTR